MVNRMKIAFIGDSVGFGFYRLGGAESLIRRLSFGLRDLGDSLTYILWGCTSSEKICDCGLTIVHSKSILAALSELRRGNYDHVVVVLLRPKHFILFWIFRVLACRTTVFHVISFSASGSSSVRGDRGLLDSSILCNGKKFVISREALLSSKDSLLVNLPVPQRYFVQKKPSSGRLKVGFMGRMDVEKGFDIVLDLFKKLSLSDGIDLFIYTYRWQSHYDSSRLASELEGLEGVSVKVTEHTSFSPSIESEVGAYLNGCDVIVLPYRSLDRTINPPLLLLESLAAGCTVISTDVGDIGKYHPDPTLLLQVDSFTAEAAEIILRFAESRRDEVTRGGIYRLSQIYREDVAAQEFRTNMLSSSQGHG